MAFKHIGKDFLPPDVTAKVTGRARYAEDFRAEGMLFAKLLVSPMPHAKVKRIDTSAALKMKGVVAILTADDVPQFPPPEDPILTNEPLFAGQPILAVAATDEYIAAEAVERIKVDLEPLPFVTDPLDSLYPGGPNARENANVANIRLNLQTLKWEAGDFANAGDGKLPMGKPAEQWSYGDVDAAMAKAKLVIDESFVTQGLAHHSMEPRSAMATWQNGKCIVYGSSQSGSFVVPGLARLVGVKPEEIVYVGEYCGGGFGSKAGAYPLMAIPAHLSKKAGKPVLLRITRAEEFALGQGRPGFQGRVKIGFAENGRILAMDMYVVHENGPNTGFPDFRNAGSAASIVFQPETMRWRGISVLTNTPPRGAQRGPGENQIALALEPLIDKAARELNLDRVAIRRINAPDNDGKIGERREPLSSAYLKDALDKGAAQFKWEEKKKLSGQRQGSKVIGIGVGQAYHSAGSFGFDGLVRITPDGKIHIHTGVGNLGTFSYASTSRIAAEVLNCKWENCIIERGDSRRHLPWNLGQFGSNTNYTMSRTNYVAAMDAKQKLLEIAAANLGGKPEDYDLGEEVVVSKADRSKSVTFAKAAQLAIDMGGKFSGREMAEDLNPITKASVSALAGTGLIGVAKDKLPKKGLTPALAAAFAMVEVDTETGKVKVLEVVNVADCGYVIHPAGLATQVNGATVMGLGLACLERYVYDPKLGLPANVGFYQCKPPSYLDVPPAMEWAAVDKPDGDNPMGVKGIGEPIQGSAASAIVSAISDALGGHLFNRTPIVADMIVNQVAKQAQSYKPLQVNTM
ncbi:MAG: xanthine dehydrogenase family protein molybdopterin-binding subunit [Alphaproteobacteria bacterium]|nr:xanthine dehydrogenase family protein molybdopterin-binding subunit [Alphaproteobacteria bacterium]